MTNAPEERVRTQFGSSWKFDDRLPGPIDPAFASSILSEADSLLSQTYLVRMGNGIIGHRSPENSISLDIGDLERQRARAVL